MAAVELAGGSVAAVESAGGGVAAVELTGAMAAEKSRNEADDFTTDEDSDDGKFDWDPGAKVSSILCGSSCWDWCGSSCCGLCGRSCRQFCVGAKRPTLCAASSWSAVCFCRPGLRRKIRVAAARRVGPRA